MTRNLKNKARILAVLLLLAVSSCNNHTESAQEDLYICPMHPTVTSHEPGTCPICGMNLVPHGGTGEELATTPELARVLKSPDESIVASVNTVRAEYKSMPIDVTVNGIVTYDTRKVHTIPSRVAGRLEKVYITYEYQPVKAGQKVADIYSPGLNTAQRELIFLLDNDSENTTLIDAARRKLELLGMTRVQINALETKRVVTSTVSVYSPYSGYIITAASPPTLSAPTISTEGSEGSMTKGMSGGSMSAVSEESPSNRGVLVRAGDYVSEGQTLFTLVDSKALRIELTLPGTAGHNVRSETNAQLSMGGRNIQDVTIDFVEPFVSKGQPFTRLRVYAEHQQDLRIGSLVSARIHIDTREALWVPRESVVDLGTQQVVFVEQRGVLKPKVVQTGITADGMIEIKNGLPTSDEIAANAQFLVDSESFVKPIN